VIYQNNKFYLQIINMIKGFLFIFVFLSFVYICLICIYLFIFNLQCNKESNFLPAQNTHTLVTFNVKTMFYNIIFFINLNLKLFCTNAKLFIYLWIIFSIQFNNLVIFFSHKCFDNNEYKYYIKLFLAIFLFYIFPKNIIIFNLLMLYFWFRFIMCPKIKSSNDMTYDL